MGLPRRLPGLAALAILAVALAGCTPPPPPAIVDYAVRYGSIGELVASADAVVVGRVAETSQGRVLDQEDVVFTTMNVQVAAEQVWAGRMPTAAFTIERFGWERAARRPGWRGWLDVAGEREWHVAGELRLKQGHRGVFFLARSNHAPGWYGLGPEGLYLIDGAQVVDTDRSYPLVRRIESMTVAQLQGAVADAAAARAAVSSCPRCPAGRSARWS